MSTRKCLSYTLLNTYFLLPYSRTFFQPSRNDTAGKYCKLIVKYFRAFFQLFVETITRLICIHENNDIYFFFTWQDSCQPWGIKTCIWLYPKTPWWNLYKKPQTFVFEIHSLNQDRFLWWLGNSLCYFSLPT